MASLSESGQIESDRPVRLAPGHCDLIGDLHDWSVTLHCKRPRRFG